MNAVNLKCTNDGHNLDVIGLCFSPQCTQESKLCCGKCFTGSHLKCLSDNSIMIIEDLINENYDDIIKITPFNLIQYPPNFKEELKNNIKPTESYKTFATSLDEKFELLIQKFSEKLIEIKEQFLFILMKE